MATVPGLKLSKSGVSQKLDLEELLGVSFEGQRALRLAIAQKAIDYIADRTKNQNVDVNGAAFKPYSLKYKNSTTFRLLKDGSVDLKLTGNMLGDLDVLSDDDSSVEIGLADQTEILKAYNHNVGDTLPKRQWFGITKSELKKIVQEDFADEIRDLKSGPAEDRPRTVGDILNDTLTRAADKAAQNLRFKTIGDIDG